MLVAGWNRVRPGDPRTVTVRLVVVLIVGIGRGTLVEVFGRLIMRQMGLVGLIVAAAVVERVVLRMVRRGIQKAN